MKEALRQLGVVENTTMRPPLLQLDAAEVAAVTEAMSQVRPAASGSLATV
jgi:dihydrodipicolinate synthase/N-acetylneuraminate lyase